MDIDPIIIAKMRGWCARQERSQEEVKRKLYALGVKGKVKDALVALLIEEGYINEKRFAEAFVSGKFAIKGWGNRKIMQGLRQRGVDERLAKKALDATDNKAYTEKMNQILERYAQRIKLRDSSSKAKMARYLLQKGYEPDLVWEAVNRYFA